jgi:putative ABC transport system substrate-binding protein
VTTDVSPAQQFEMLRKLVPSVKRIAIIYCPQYTEATVANGEKAAKALGIELVRFPVEPYRVDEAIDKLSRESVDAVWTVTDPGVVVPASAKRILVFALKAKLPVIGFSPAMVRAGALLGFEIDPAAIGRQAGGAAGAILRQGKKAADFNLLYPDTTLLVLNAAVAQQIGVVLPEALAAKAQMVQGE